MVLAHAMWIHGHSMQIQYPQKVTFERRGSYIIVTGQESHKNWFHFAIPTPVIVNDNRLQAGSVMLRFRVRPNEHGVDSSVEAVHVYDGENLIEQYGWDVNAIGDGLGLTPENWSFERFQMRNNAAIRWGLGITIGVGFGGEENASHRIEFSSVGCDFFLPDN